MDNMNLNGNEKKSVYLIGFMGVGKSSVAAELATLLSMHVVELDQQIEKTCHLSIEEMFETMGEAFFRDQESRELFQLQSQGACIVSCGGGTPLRKSNGQFLKQHGWVILLTASPETIWQRLQEERGRPLLKEKTTVMDIRELWEQRQNRYEELADVIIDTDGQTILQVCETIVLWIKERELVEGGAMKVKQREQKTDKIGENHFHSHENKEFNLKNAGIVTGAIVGGVIGGSISLVGKVTKKPLIEEIGDSVISSGVLSGQLVGTVASGAKHVAVGVAAHQPKTTEKGVFELKKTGGQFLDNVVGNVKMVTKESVHIVHAVKNKDSDQVKKGIRKLGKIVAVQMLTVGALDIKEQEEKPNEKK